MGQPDPALGIDVDFPELDVRNGLTFAMQLGKANSGLSPVFVFPAGERTFFRDGVQLTTPPRLDRDGRPLDPTIEVRRVTAREVEVDCGIEIQPVDREELPVGSFRPSKAIITVLDGEYAKIKGAREMRYNEDLYVLGYEPQVDGLFGINVHTLTFFAVRDS